MSGKGRRSIRKEKCKDTQFLKMQSILSDFKQNNLITQSLVLLSDRAGVGAVPILSLLSDLGQASKFV